jgi:hypothetical protein
MANTKLDITASQMTSMDALLYCEGWSDVSHLSKHGANPASLLNLVKRGMAEVRESVSAKGFPFLEFRQSNEWIDLSGLPKSNPIGE